MKFKKVMMVVMGLLCSIYSYSQPDNSETRQQEMLNRALTAVSTAGGKTFLSWRYFESDQQQVHYELFHNGTKIGSFKRTNYVYPIESDVEDQYELRVVDENGTIIESDVTTPWVNGALRIPLSRPTGNSAVSSGLSYTPNDCSIGDVDGDGVMEIFVKWDPSTAKDNSQSGKTDNVLIDCYRMDGTLLWRIDLGPNIRAGAHYTQYLVYDFDGDGSAELICKTAPWSKDGKGKYVSEAATDNVIKNQTSNTTSYRNGNGYVLTGPEYLTVFSGRDGHAIHTTWYNPDRSLSVNAKKTNPSHNSNWGDNYGNRCDRYLAAVAYLDGEKPSAILCRGYYSYAFVWAVDFNGTELVHRWLHASVSKTKVEHYDANWTKTSKTYSSSFAGEGRNTLYENGNHNMTVGDVDGDGKDEIIWGSCALDDDGQLLYSVGFGHGDAMHMGTFDPSRNGLQVFDVHEDKGTYSWDLHDAATGEIIFKGGNSGVDNGRGMCGHLLPGVNEAVFSSSDDRSQRSCATGSVINSKSASMNFRLYWDADLQEELSDGGYSEAYTISKYTTKTGNTSTIATLAGNSCNSTKRTPNLQADLFGDWREEVILHDNDALYIHTTTIPTDYNVPCLLTDHTYRMAIAWQQTAYNQPPHLGYYLPNKAITITEPDETLLPDDYVQQFEESQVSIVWALNEGIITDAPTITFTSGSEIPVETSIAVGEKLEVSGAGTITNGRYTETKFKSLEKRTTATPEQTVTFNMTPAEGYKFKPTSLQLIATRFGTNGGAIDIVWQSAAGSTTCISNQQPKRNNDYTTTDENGNQTTVSQSPYYSAYSKNPGTDYTRGGNALFISLYNLDVNKEIGLCNVTIKGKLRKPIPYTSGITTFTTPLYGIKDSQSPTPLYNLQGQRIDNSHQLPSGIYIRQGRKYVVK